MLPVGPSYYFRSERPEMIRYSHILIRHKDCLDRQFGKRHLLYPRNTAASLIIGCYVLIVTKQNTFESLAQQWSDCPSGLKGGDCGWVSYKQSRPHIRLYPFRLKVGEMTLPVATPEGFEIFLRTE